MPFVENEVLEMRNTSGSASLAFNANEFQKQDHGIKGRNFLINLNSIDIVNGNILGYMHSISSEFSNLFFLLFGKPRILKTFSCFSCHYFYIIKS